MAIFNSYVKLPEGRWQVLPILVQIFQLPTRYKVNTSWKRLQLHPASPNIHKLKSKNATMPKAGPSPKSPPKALARISVHFAALMARWSSRSYGYVIIGWWVWKERHLMNLRDLLLETYREQDMWLCGKIQHISIQSHTSPNLNSDTKLWTRSSSNGFVITCNNSNEIICSKPLNCQLRQRHLVEARDTYLGKDSFIQYFIIFSLGATLQHGRFLHHIHP